MARHRCSLVLLILAILFASWRWIGSTRGTGSLSTEDPLRLAVTDVEGMESLQREFGAFRDRLVQQTGMPLEFFPVADRTAAIEGLRSGQIDMVITGPAEYVIFRGRAAVEPIVGFSRPNYHATISVRRDSGIVALEELRGKKIALGDLGSTSKHLGPIHLLIKAGVARDEVSVVHTGIQAGWEALLRGDVDAFATTSDKIDLLCARTPQHDTAVIARSTPLPMDVLIAARRIPTETRDRLRRVFEVDAPALIEAILQGNDNQKYDGMEFATEVRDADYDLVREMFVAAGLEHLLDAPAPVDGPP